MGIAVTWHGFADLVVGFVRRSAASLTEIVDLAVGPSIQVGGWPVESLGLFLPKMEKS